MKAKFIAGAIVLSAAALAAAPAQAIECEGNFQIQRDGTMFVTPWCEDQYLSIVAREYGANVSARTIRQNPSVKERTCRLVGYDNRVRSTCAPYLGSRNNRRPFWH